LSGSDDDNSGSASGKSDAEEDEDDDRKDPALDDDSEEDDESIVLTKVERRVLMKELKNLNKRQKEQVQLLEDATLELGDCDHELVLQQREFNSLQKNLAELHQERETLIKSKDKVDNFSSISAKEKVTIQKTCDFIMGQFIERIDNVNLSGQPFATLDLFVDVEFEGSHGVFKIKNVEMSFNDLKNEVSLFWKIPEDLIFFAEKGKNELFLPKMKVTEQLFPWIMVRKLQGRPDFPKLEVVLQSRCEYAEMIEVNLRKKQGIPMVSHRTTTADKEKLRQEQQLEKEIQNKLDLMEKKEKEGERRFKYGLMKMAIFIVLALSVLTVCVTFRKIEETSQLASTAELSLIEGTGQQQTTSIEESVEWIREQVPRTIFFADAQIYGYLNAQNDLLARTQVRQIRLKTVNCDRRDLEDELASNGTICLSDEISKEPYGNNNEFTYTSDSNGYSVRGPDMYYEPGGFIIELNNRDPDAWEATTKSMIDDGWVDLSTKVILLTFNIFNPSMTAALRFIIGFEQTSSGGIIPFHRIAAYNTDIFDETLTVVAIVIQCLVLIPMIYVSIKELELDEATLTPLELRDLKKKRKRLVKVRFSRVRLFLSQFRLPTILEAINLLSMILLYCLVFTEVAYSTSLDASKIDRDKGEFIDLSDWPEKYDTVVNFNSIAILMLASSFLLYTSQILVNVGLLKMTLMNYMARIAVFGCVAIATVAFFLSLVAYFNRGDQTAIYSQFPILLTANIIRTPIDVAEFGQAYTSLWVPLFLLGLSLILTDFIVSNLLVAALTSQLAKSRQDIRMQNLKRMEERREQRRLKHQIDEIQSNRHAETTDT